MGKGEGRMLASLDVPFIDLTRCGLRMIPPSCPRLASSHPPSLPPFHHRDTPNG